MSWTKTLLDGEITHKAIPVCLQQLSSEGSVLFNARSNFQPHLLLHRFIRDLIYEALLTENNKYMFLQRTLKGLSYEIDFENVDEN
jgi:hypothetical protein